MPGASQPSAAGAPNGAAAAAAAGTWSNQPRDRQGKDTSTFTKQTNQRKHWQKRLLRLINFNWTGHSDRIIKITRGYDLNSVVFTSGGGWKYDM